MKNALPLLSLLLMAGSASAQFAGYVNHGLVAVGRVPADATDARGPGLDTLGGFGSAAVFDPATWSQDASTYRGTLYALPDRGFGDGTQDYLPRIQVFALAVTPYYGAGPAPQNQIQVSNTATLLLTYDGGTHFTGFDANDTNVVTHPQSAPGSPGGGRRSLDGEGLVRLPDGRFYVSDEYGPFIYRFSPAGELLGTFEIPASLLPKRGGAFPRPNQFTAASAPDSGRRNNRGLEGLSLTPDGKRLFAMLQSPTMQDAGGGAGGRNTRLVVFDADETSPTYGRALAQYVYELTLRGSAQTNRHTPVSEILALNRTEFLVLERDQIGQGIADTNIAPTYKSVVLASLAGATNLIDSSYDLERGAPGQSSLPASGLPADIRPVARQDFVDLLDPDQLGKFGLNARAPHDTNTISEKIEALTLIPLHDSQAPEDYLLLIINDNDFKAPVVYHNGVAVATNEVGLDSMLMAYRVTLPTFGAPAPPNQPPGVYLSGPANATLAAPVSFTLTARTHDQDGRVLRVEFWEGDTKLDEDSTYPFELPVNLTPGRTLSVRAVAYDNDGASTESAVYSVRGVEENFPPEVELTGPAPGAQFMAPAQIQLTARATDGDGWISRVVFYRGATPVATNLAAPFQASLTNHPLGSYTFTAVATDNLGLNSTSAPVSITVSRNTASAPLTLQILHASDFEAGLDALTDAPAFSSVLSALQAEYPGNTLILSSGDNYIPGPFFNAAGDPLAGLNGVGGRADIVLLNALGIQASALGNHEFDAGTAHVRSLLLRDAAVGYSGTLFPYLSANLNFAPDSNLANLVVADGQNGTSLSNRLARSCVLSVAGQLVGIVGATTRDLRAISSPGNVGVDPNITAAVQAAVDALLPLGVNKVIVLAHLQQYANEFTLARELRDVDVVIAGGSHAIFAKPTDRLRPGDTAAAEYPVWLSSAAGEPVAVVNTGANYRYVGRLIVEFGPEGLIQSVDPASGAYATDAQGVLDTGSYPPVPRVQEVVTTLGSIIAAKDGATFGRSLVYLNGLRQNVRTEESNLGNLTADANLWRGRLADPTVSISLKNGGGIRDSIGAVLGYGGGARYGPPLANPAVGKQPGQISQLDIENALRFNNGLSLLTLTAQQLRDTLEWSVAATAPGATPGQFPQVGGLWFSFDPSRPPMSYTRSGGTVTGIAHPGERVRTLVARRADGSLDLVVEDGVLVGDPNRTFRLVTLGFLADGGDTYYPLTQAAQRVNLAPTSGNTFTTDGAEQWALAQYLTHLERVAQEDTPAELDQRVQNLSRRSDTVTWPRLISLAISEGRATLRFEGLRAYAYQVQASTDLVNWVNLGWAVAGPDGGFEFVDEDHGQHPQRFYRLIGTRLPGARLAVFSDPHLMHPDLLVADGPAFQSYLAGDRKLLRESAAITEAVVDELLAARPEIVLVPGDLTKDGELISHQAMARALGRLRTAGIKVFVCPGNHDVTNPHAYAFNGAQRVAVPSVSPAEFAAIYQDFGYGEAIARDPESLSYVAEPVPGLWILSMDAARYDRNTAGSPYTGGYFDAARWNWITNQLALARTAGKFVLGMVHHGVTEHYAGQKALFPDYVLDEYEQVREQFVQWGLKVMFTGHYHAQDIVRFDHPAGTLFDIQTGSTVTWPVPYRLLTLASDGTLAITSHQITQINFDLGGLDFPTYAYNYLSNGLLSLSAYLLTQPPYNLPAAAAGQIAPAVTEAFLSHYQGDESTRPISPATQAILASLLEQTDPMARMLGNALGSLFNDPAPADNEGTLNLLTGAAGP